MFSLLKKLSSGATGFQTGSIHFAYSAIVGFLLHCPYHWVSSTESPASNSSKECEKALAYSPKGYGPGGDPLPDDATSQAKDVDQYKLFNILWIRYDQ